MDLFIDGLKIKAEPGRTLLDLIKSLGLDQEQLSCRPIAAKIAGEVFNLNYIPVREKDYTPERQSIRRAMAASDGKVRLLRYSDPSGKDVYSRTVQFILFLALHQLWPNARTKMNCTVGSGLLVEVFDAENFSVDVLKGKLNELIAEDFPLIRRRMTTQEAITR